MAQLIRHYNPYAIIVFITSRSEFATLTYKYQVSALDFVDKDINDEMFKKRIEQNIFYTKSMLLENEDVVDYFDYNYKGNDLKFLTMIFCILKQQGYLINCALLVRILQKSFMVP